MTTEAFTETETLTGKVGRFIYKTETFAIFKLDNTIVLGEVAGVNEGDQLTVRGLWQDHPKYGRQFKIKSWEKPIPTTKEAVIQFLSSGLIKGIGPVLAKRIVDCLGPNAIEIIMDDSSVLKKVKGIGRKAARIQRQLQETYEVQQSVSKLLELGLSLSIALKAYKHYGRSSIELVKQNPYCLTEIDLIGFHRADEIARSMGLELDSPFRIKAGILYVLEDALWSEGHTYLPKDKLVARALELLNHSVECVNDSMVKKVMIHLREIVGKNNISLAWTKRCEEAIAKDVIRLASQKFKSSPVQANVIKNITLSEAQKNAVKTVLGEGLSILTGGPGVGKTFTVNAIIQAFKLYAPWEKVVLCAPTGRAARQLKDVTGYEASTVHRLLGLRNGKSTYNRSNPLDCGLLVLDEASMVDIVMQKHLLDAIPNGCRVLLVGDADQLPSVGPGNVLRDLLGKVPTIHLTEIFRQAAKSQIVINAHRVNKGLLPIIDSNKDDFIFIGREEPEDIAQCIATCVERLDCDPTDIQVLSPMRKGLVGTVKLNQLIQGEAPGPQVKHGKYIYRVGDKVIHTKNNYEKGVFNGDIGIIKKITRRNGKVTILVRYNGHTVPYSRDDLKELELALSITIHKSQGSEFETVIIPITTSHYIMLHRNLFYTAITRAKERVVLVGTRKALAIAVKNNKPIQRYTRLPQLLREARKRASHNLATWKEKSSVLANSRR